MSGTQKLPFDKIYDEANQWVKEISERMGHPDRQVAYHALRGVLFALRDRLPPAELFQFSAQLPTVIRGILFESYVPANKPEKLNRDQFLERISVELQTVDGGHPQHAATAVLGHLKQHLGEQPIKHIQMVLPEDIQKILEAA
jgi:uncharacterized protein (DUF2267 family)